MGDITTTWDPQAGEGAWAVAPPALADGGDLGTAVLISLFTDRQASDDDVIPDGSGDRRGWWGDLAMGSRLWLLVRAKQTEETRRRAVEYAEEALAWMVTDGVAAAVAVVGAWIAPHQLGLTVTISRTDGTKQVLPFAWTWGGSATPQTPRPPSPSAGGQLDFSDPANSGLAAAI